jgi:hypothetical protein
MTTIIYKKLLERYIIDAIHESEGDGVTLTLCEPIDARIVIGEEIYQVKKGISKISGIPEGLIQPKLYTGTGKEDIEGFIVSYGEVVRTSPDSEFAKTVGEAVIEILQRLGEHEKDISEIKGRLDQKLKF